ncbi:serine acetyltransferase [Hahella sp. CR1]|uniref:serine acetyltransferase n=1 Tax=Hahella sp. CR1 TaxID=2992807 RepID=UPI002441474E|nr:serine acetyltransferase [Hahella sp. CR1]MDG9668655.1 serine acetyltransferase [Hahella sp. CR1]
MQLSLAPEHLAHYVSKQLDHFFPDGRSVETALSQSLPETLKRLEFCFSHIRLKYYVENDQAVFNHLHGDHYATFLYFLANQAYRDSQVTLAEKAFLLNKALHGVDAFYGVELPRIFLLVHPLGTVLGSASYSDYLTVYQGVTIGSTYRGDYPTIGEGAVFCSGSKLIGNCRVGANVTFAADAFVQGIDTPDDSLVVGKFPDCRISPNKLDNRRVKFG